VDFPAFDFGVLDLLAGVPVLAGGLCLVVLVGIAWLVGTLPPTRDTRVKPRNVSGMRRSGG
jgi:hypothetical protein